MQQFWYVRVTGKKNLPYKEFSLSWMVFLDNKGLLKIGLDTLFRELKK